MSAKDVKTDRITDTIDHISQEAVRSSAAKLIPRGAVVVVARSGILRHSLPVAVLDVEATINQDLKAIDPAPGLLSEYLAWALRRFDRDILSTCAKDGTTVQSIEFSRLKEFSIPVAPLAEQRRIVEAIEEQLSRLGAGQYSLERAKRNVKRLRASVLGEAVHGRLVRRAQGDTGGTFPGHWNQAELATLAKVGSGATPKRENPRYWSGGTIPWVTSGQLTAPRVSEPAAYITQAALEETSVKLWPAGTLLVAMYGEGRTRGNCSELAFPSTTNQACAAIVVHQDAPVLQPFLKLYFAASYAANRRLASGGVQPNLSLARLKSLRVPVPPQDEQLEILREVERQSSVLDELERILDVELARGRALDRGILMEAFAGRLVPQDSTNDAAPKPLGRISAEKATA